MNEHRNNRDRSDSRSESPIERNVLIDLTKKEQDHRHKLQENQQKANKIVQGFRYFNVYGNHEEHKGSQASPVTQFTQQAKAGEIKLFEGSDNYLRDFIAVEDICRVHVQFINKVTQSGIWNVGTGKTTSFQQIANLISQKHNAKIKYVEMPDILKRSYQAYTCADTTKLEDALGVQRWITVEEWLDKYKL